MRQLRFMAAGEVSYAQTGDTHVAYRVVGEPGDVDVVVVASSFFPFEMLDEDRHASRFMAGLAAIGRLVVFDKRGVGLSDPMTDWSRSAQEQWAEDLCAVIEAVGSDGAVVVSWEELGVARQAAVLRPDLFSSMVLVNPARFAATVSHIGSDPGEDNLPTRTREEMTFPSRIGDPDFWDWLSKAGRSGASPAAAAQMWGHLFSLEGSLTPPGIDVPTLVLHNRDCIIPEDEAQAVAAEIPGSTFVQVPGPDAYPIAGDIDALIAEIAHFVTGAPSDLAPERAVAAVLFTDLVDSTQRAVNLGDEQWRDLLDVHDQAVHQAVLHRGGRVVKYTGDGVLALLPSATAAFETARAIREQLITRGLQIRTGIHVGDVDMRGDDVSGLTVNVAARIMSHAGTGETLVSDSVRQATLGSEFSFENIGVVELKGIPEPFTLHRWL